MVILNPALFKEKQGLKPINTYGYTKLMFEQMLQTWPMPMKIFHSLALRYFNAAGDSSAGHLGECQEPETHFNPKYSTYDQRDIKIDYLR